MIPDWLCSSAAAARHRLAGGLVDGSQYVVDWRRERFKSVIVGYRPIIKCLLCISELALLTNSPLRGLVLGLTGLS